MVRVNPPFKHALPITLVVMVLLAGCVAPQDGSSSDDPDPDPDVLEYRYHCPPGDTLTLSNGLCVTTFQDARETFEEPYLAVHPDRPEVMVLGMNAWHAEPRPVLREGAPSSEVGRVALFVTEDGGATWKGVPSPPILYGSDAVGKTSYSGDPVVEFDSRGVLHYLQTSVSFDSFGSGSFPYIDIQYARSDDLGASWAENKLLVEDGDNDRPWLTIGPDDRLLVTWRNNIGGYRPPELAWSADGGRTWDVVAAPAACTHGDRALVHGNDVLMACALHDGETATEIQINRFDLEAQHSEAVGQVPAPEGWDPGTDAFVQWDVSPNGSVIALATRHTTPGGYVAFSRDGGATWSDPHAFVDICACPTETGSLHLYGAKFDTRGGFHLMLADAMVQTPDSANEGNVRYTTGERAVFHAAVDTEGTPLVAQRLPTSAEEDARVPPGLAAPIGRDDYYIPAFWGDGGAIVWTRDKGVDLTHIVVETSTDASAS